MDEDIDPLIKKLSNILRNLKKCPNRKYLKSTLQAKASESRQIYDNLIEDKEQRFLTKAVRDIYSQIKIFIDTRLDTGIHLLKFRQVAQVVLATEILKKGSRKVTMANNMEIVKLIATLLPQFKGNADRLEGTTAALRAIDTMVNDNNRAIAIQVILSRLEGKARSAVNAAPATVNEIITSLEQRCRITQSPEAVVAKLNATRQTSTIVDFTDKIEKLALELEKTYLTENVPLVSATRLASKAAVKALTNGVKNSEIQLILKAGQFENLTSAITKVTELEADQSQQKQVFSTNGHQPRYQPRPTFPNHQPRMITSTYRGRRSTYRGRNTNTANRFQYQPRPQTNNFPDRNHSHQSNNRGRRGTNSRVYVAQENSSQQQSTNQSNQQQVTNNPFLEVQYGRTQ